jgi:hypothetical protein
MRVIVKNITMDDLIHTAPKYGMGDIVLLKMICSAWVTPVDQWTPELYDSQVF